MNCFVETLTSEGKSAQLPEEYNYFGKLIGSWKLDYTNHNIARSVKGEWHFSWVLEGMAVQDVIILPSRGTETKIQHPLTEYGTSLRVYNPNTHVWDVVYCYTGKVFRLVAKKQDGMIVLTHLDDEGRKWIFKQIRDNYFHWQDINVKEDGDWHINADIYAERT